jgi:hypothetical protein
MVVPLFCLGRCPDAHGHFCQTEVTVCQVFYRQFSFFLFAALVPALPVVPLLKKQFALDRRYGCAPSDNGTDA